MPEFLSDFWQGFSGQTSYRPQEDYTQFKQRLQGAAFGQEPSAAQAQLQSGKEQATAAAASQAASARGNTGQRASAQRAATFGAAAASQQAANQAAALRAQEMASARQTMADYIGREQQAMKDIELANAQGRQKGYGIIGAVGGGLLSGLSDVRAKQDVVPAVSLMGDSSHASIDARRRAEDAAREEAERKARWERAGSSITDAFTSMAGGGGGFVSDRRAKELEAENKGLRSMLTGAVETGERMTREPGTSLARGVERLSTAVGLGPGRAEFKRAEYVPHGSYFQPEMRGEADIARAEAAYRRENAEAIRRQAAAEVADRMALERAEAERQKALAQEQAYRKAYDPRAYGGQTEEPMTSDRRAKELERELDAVRDETLSGLRGVPTARFPDVTGFDRARAGAMAVGTPAERRASPEERERAIGDMANILAQQSRRDLAPLKPYEYRYKPEFAAQQGTDTEPRLGIMAQDALKSPSYRSAVVERPDGMLGLDRDRLLQANTAELAGVDKRLRELEQIKQDAIRRNTPPERR